MTLVLSVFPSFAVGGAQARFCAVANHLGSAVRHVIVAMDGNLSCRERLDPGLPVRFVDVAKSSGGLPSRLRRHRTAIAELRPDVLLTHNWGSIEWALANAPPFARPITRHVHVEDGFGPEERDRQFRRRVWARRVALRRATVVLPSRVLMRLARDVWRLPPERLEFAPNGIDLTRFAAPAERTAAAAGGQGSSRDGPVIGTVAALRPEKNIARLLRAMAMVSGSTLLVAGDGPDRASLTALAESLGLDKRVSFIGHLTDSTAAYRAMDVFALSSDTEQMPLTVLEAMAAGLPIAATDVGDVADMVAAENAPFVVQRDETALSTALTHLVSDGALRRQVGMANLAKAGRDYDQDRMFHRWQELLVN